MSKGPYITGRHHDAVCACPCAHEQTKTQMLIPTEMWPINLSVQIPVPTWALQASAAAGPRQLHFSLRESSLSCTITLKCSYCFFFKKSVKTLPFRQNSFSVMLSEITIPFSFFLFPLNSELSTFKKDSSPRSSSRNFQTSDVCQRFITLDDACCCWLPLAEKQRYRRDLPLLLTPAWTVVKSPVLLQWFPCQTQQRKERH